MQRNLNNRDFLFLWYSVATVILRNFIFILLLLLPLGSSAGLFDNIPFQDLGLTEITKQSCEEALLKNTTENVEAFFYRTTGQNLTDYEIVNPKTDTTSGDAVIILIHKSVERWERYVLKTYDMPPFRGVSNLVFSHFLSSLKIEELDPVKIHGHTLVEKNGKFLWHFLLEHGGADLESQMISLSQTKEGFEKLESVLKRTAIGLAKLHTQTIEVNLTKSQAHLRRKNFEREKELLDEMPERIKTWSEELKLTQEEQDYLLQKFSAAYDSIDQALQEESVVNYYDPHIGNVVVHPITQAVKMIDLDSMIYNAEINCGNPEKFPEDCVVTGVGHWTIDMGRFYESINLVGVVNGLSATQIKTLRNHVLESYLTQKLKRAPTEVEMHDAVAALTYIRLRIYNSPMIFGKYSKHLKEKTMPFFMNQIRDILNSI